MERWEREGTQRLVPHGQIGAAPVRPWDGQPKQKAPERRGKLR